MHEHLLLDSILQHIIACLAVVSPRNPPDLETTSWTISVASGQIQEPKCLSCFSKPVDFWTDITCLIYLSDFVFRFTLLLHPLPVAYIAVIILRIGYMVYPLGDTSTTA